MMNEEQLRILIDRFLAGTATPEELRQLNDFDAHFADAQEVYDLPDQEKKDLSLNIYREITLKKEQPATHRLIYLKWLGAIAAVLTLIMLSISFYQQDGQLQELFSGDSRITAAEGEIKEVKLSDGSIVTLNSGSSLTFPEKFTGNIREVTLRGEAFFSVAHNKKKPFLVHAGAVVTKVLGTSFDISAYKELPEIKVTVATGRVGVSHDLKEMAVLTPDKQIVYDKISGKSEVKDVEQMDYSGWRAGTLIFKQATFEEVALTLKQAYGLEITIEDDHLKNYRITSRFQKNMPLKMILDIVTTASCSSYTIQDKKVYVKGKGCRQSVNNPISNLKTP